MIETDRQRRWWFATHPEFGEGRAGAKNRGNEKETHRPKGYSPEDVDAYVDEGLKYEDGVVADLLRSIKRNFGTEAYADESDPKPSGHPAADQDSYDKYENVPDWSDASAPQSGPRVPTPEEEALMSDPHTFLDLAPFARFITAPVQSLRGLLWRMPREAVFSAKKGGPRDPPRLPPKGTPERAKIERDRKKGIDLKKKEELDDILSGGKGHERWSAEQREYIRRTGEYPRGVEWHHDPPVAKRPDLAADPKVVTPMPGGKKQHFEIGHPKGTRYFEE